MWRFAPARTDTRQARPKHAAPSLPDHACLSCSCFSLKNRPFLKFRTRNFPRVPSPIPYSRDPTRLERKPSRGPGLHVRRSAQFGYGWGLQHALKHGAWLPARKERGNANTTANRFIRLRQHCSQINQVGEFGTVSADLTRGRTLRSQRAVSPYLVTLSNIPIWSAGESVRAYAEQGAGEENCESENVRSDLELPDSALLHTLRTSGQLWLVAR